MTGMWQTLSSCVAWVCSLSWEPCRVLCLWSLKVPLRDPRLMCSLPGVSSKTLRLRHGKDSLGLSGPNCQGFTELPSCDCWPAVSSRKTVMSAWALLIEHREVAVWEGIDLACLLKGGGRTWCSPSAAWGGLFPARMPWVVGPKRDA